MASLDDVITVGNSFNKNLSQLVVALQNFQALYQGVIDVAHGGTGRTSLTSNNVLLGNGTSPINFVAPGTVGNVLTSDGTTWNSTALPVAPANVSSISFGTTGLTPSTATTGAVTVAGTLNVENGGTETTSFNAYGVVCGGTGTQTALQSVSPGTSGQILTSNGAAALPTFQTLNKFTQETSQSLTSGNLKTFSIPSWVKRIVVVVYGVTVSVGNYDLIVRLGDSGGISSTGYSSQTMALGTGGLTLYNNTVGFVLGDTIGSATTTSASCCLYNVSSNLWVASGMTTVHGATYTYTNSGAKTITLTQLGLALSTGNFTAGTFNILYD